MPPLIIDAAAFCAEFARLVLATGLSVLVLHMVVAWAQRATKTSEDSSDE